MDEKPTHSELERLDKTQSPIDRACACDGQIIHHDLSQHALSLDQIARAEGPLVLDQAAVLAHNAYHPQNWKRMWEPKYWHLARKRRDGKY